MDFDEFARAFRERTAARLLEFEKTMSKAQEDMEKAAKQAAQDAQSATVQRRSHLSGARATQNPARRNVPGQVKSVLRRG